MPRNFFLAAPVAVVTMALAAPGMAQTAKAKPAKPVKPVAKPAAQPAKAGPSLMVGSKAPAIQVAKWIKGQPVTGFQPGNVYVVEFWATWCGPCRATIPHLTELAKKYEGKATITGVSVFERPEPDYQTKVADFVKEMGEKMEYRVAVDGPQGTMGKTWMEAAKQEGIPTAFVVGKKGTIEWIGHPMDGLDEVIGQVIEGKFDPKAVAAAKAKREAEQAKIQQTVGGIVEKAKAGDFKAAIAEADRVLAANPELEKQGLWNLKLQLMVRGNDPGAGAYMKKLGEGILKDNPLGLNQLAWMIVDPESPVKERNYDVALSLAQRAVELTKEEDAAILDTLAYAHFKKGNVDQAVTLGEKALALLSKPGADANPEAKAEISQHLQEFRAAKK